MEHQYTLLVEDEGDGMLWAKVEELPGCFASGADMDELMEAAVEAIQMYEADDLTQAPAFQAQHQGTKYGVSHAKVALCV